MGAYKIVTDPLRSGGLHPHLVARNGYPTSGEAARSAAEYVQFLLAWRLKRLFEKHINVSDALTGHTTGVDTWRFRCHTSPNGSKIRALVVVYPAATGSVNPSFTISSYRVDLASTSTKTHYTGDVELSASADPSPDDYEYVLVDLGAASADTTYEITLSVANGCRPIGITVFEEPLLSIVTASAYELDTGKFGMHLPVTDSAMNETLTRLEKAYKRQGAHYVGWSTDTSSPIAVSATATPKNILDTSVTTGSANSPGFPISTTYRGTHDSTDVPVVFAAYMKTSTGTATLTAVDSSNNTIGTITTGSTTGTWVTGALNLTAGTTSKIDILASNSPNATVSVYAVSIYDYVS
jgi:hypothetical protein